MRYVSDNQPMLPDELKGNPVDSRFATARKTFVDWFQLAVDRRVRLAVTGLNQSGKTVFITSLIHQLLLAARSGWMPFFSVTAEGRFGGAKIMPQPNMDVSAFRYDQFIQSLTESPPAWPHTTDGLSEIRLAIRFRPGGFFQKRLSNSATLFLDITDYPGEWLLDLPLLNLSFEAWSKQVFQLCEREPRLSLSREWLDFIAGINPDQIADEGVLRQASNLFTQFLKACKRNKTGMSLLQPGRFLIPGSLKDAPLLTFCPLKEGGAMGKGSFHDVMSVRFESYKVHVVRKFYRDHFTQFDRQIVLVDLLKALNYGPKSFGEMQNALRSILDNFDYGHSSLLSRFFRPRIDKLLFVATKADHIAANQHPNLERLLDRMVIRPASDAVFQGVEVKTMTIASMVCTETVVREHQGRRLSFVRGVPKGRKDEVLLFPGEIPEAIPDLDEWEKDRFNFMEFQPGYHGRTENDGIPHLRLDQALEFLLGDKLS